MTLQFCHRLSCKCVSGSILGAIAQLEFGDELDVDFVARVVESAAAGATAMAAVRATRGCVGAETGS